MTVIPFAARWTIPENQLISLKDSINGHLESTSFSKIPGFEYYLSIYPNGSNDGGRRGHTAIGLFLKLKSGKKVDAEYTYLIESANYSRTINEFFIGPVNYAYVICTTEDFFNPENKYIVDGKFTIKVYGTFRYETNDAPSFEIATAKQQKWDGGELGNGLWEEDGNKDFAIVADKKEINVHKLVLQTRSDVFRGMFNPETKESIENKVEIPDFSFDVVETAVKMIYNCNFTSSLSLDELMSLLQFFDKYQIQSLKHKVELLLINQISAATVCRLTNCSIFTNSIHLKKKCMEFLMDAFASKIYLSDIEILDKDVLVKLVQNSLYTDVEIY